MNTPMRTRARWRRVLALLASSSIVLAACGGGDDSGEDGGGTTDTTAQSGAVDPAENPDEELEPVPGGRVVFGLEADTSTPWTPQNSVCAISCHMVMRTVYDALMAFDENGEAVPYLAESMTPNEDFTEWSIVPRPDVTFHDGTAFDAAAICDNLTRHLSSILTGKALLNVSDEADGGTGPQVSEDGSACVVPMNDPWPRFPVYLTGQIGYMASPTWLEAVAGDPSLASQPVGTGPFVYASYEPGGSYTGTKNADYWRADEGLPYLNEIELRVFVDVQSRVNALRDGQVDIIQLSNGEFIADLRGDESIEMFETDTFGETNYLLINQRDPVMQDIRVRRALALATDNESLSVDRSAGVNPPANGPFSVDQVGYLEDTGYPEYNIEEAAALVAEYEAENGELSIQFDTTNDPYNEETNQLIAASWESIGIDVEIQTVEQGSYITNALTGNFQIFSWRNHGGVDPDSQRIWWHSETGDLATNPLALNFGGIDDPELDEQLDIVRQSTDDAEVQAAAEEINRIFGEQVYNIWTTWTVWGLAHKPTVHNINGFTLPGGGASITGSGIAGTVQLVQVWIEQ